MLLFVDSPVVVSCRIETWIVLFAFYLHGDILLLFRCLSLQACAVLEFV